MAQNTSQSTKIISSVKSSRYPSIELDYAIKVVSEARKFGKEITESHIAGSGKGSVKSGAFRRKKASLGYYGLIAGREGRLQITELAEKVVNPIDEEEKERSIKEAFLSPELFKKLYDSIEKNVSIKVDMLGNLLIRQYGIQPAARNEFLSTFINSGIYAGLIRYNSMETKTEIVFLEQEKKRDKNPADLLNPFEFFGHTPSSPKEDPSEKPKMEFLTVEIGLTNGTARIQVPKELTELDSKKLKAQIDVLAGTFDKK